MSGFRLLGIRPLPNCDKKLSKLLCRGRVYQFYNDVKIIPEIIENDSENISCQTFFDNSDLFSIKTDQGKSVKVNVSALVGKNGSGKSTLLELLYASVFFLADRKQLFQRDGLEYYQNELETSKAEKKAYDNNIYEHYSAIYSRKLKELQEILLTDSSIINDEMKLEKFRSVDLTLLPENYDHTINENKKILDSYSMIIEGLKLDLYVEVSTNIFQVRFNNKKVTLKQIRGKKDHNFNLENLFYNIAINYSIHSLNSRVIGKWIDPLFHKNDGYLTPLVINPMREDGNIKVNNEATLAKYRLASNLIANGKKEDFQLTENQSAKYFLYEIQPVKVELLNGKKRELTFSVLNKFEVTEKMITSALFTDEVMIYIYQKIEKILWQYPIYRKKFTSQIETSRINFSETIKWDDKHILANEIYQDGSHITYKLRQAIYYLKYYLFSDQVKTNTIVNINKQEFVVGKWSEKNGKKYLLLEVEKVSACVLSNLKKENKQIEKLKNEGKFPNKDFELSALPFLPPPVFSMEIILSTKNGELSFFSELSSGEQQMIHTLHSVYYHLNNLQSVFTIPARQLGDRKTYRNVNILFDEIELYFHPEYQRQFISRFRNGLKHLNLGGNNGIDSINVLFATHSPFILSDIPTQNVLKLKNGEPQPYNQNDQTFGANIHDLLANDFFLDNGFMGEFAKDKISEIILNLSYRINLKEIKLLKVEYTKSQANYKKMKIDALIAENEYLSRKFTLKFDDTKEKFDKIIELVGEPVIKDKLNEMCKLAFN